MVKTRILLEKVIHNIWDHTNSGGAKPDKLHEIINHRKVKEQIPRRLLSRIHGLRDMGNIGAHTSPVTQSDALRCIDDLFEILSWYGNEYENLKPLAVPITPPDPFNKYFKDSLKDSFFLFVLLINLSGLIGLIRFHKAILQGASMSFGRIYEGVFTKGIGSIDGWFVTIGYSIVLVMIVFLLAWLIFRRFRKQDFISRVLSFELMFVFVFSFQFLLLTLLDKYSNLF